jgi:hypothetical protein
MSLPTCAAALVFWIKPDGDILSALFTRQDLSHEWFSADECYTVSNGLTV